MSEASRNNVNILDTYTMKRQPLLHTTTLEILIFINPHSYNIVQVEVPITCGKIV